MTINLNVFGPLVKDKIRIVWRATWLSHISVIWVTFPNCNSLSNWLSRTSLQVTEAISLYSASALDLATTFCFFLFQEIKLPSMETQYAEVDILIEDPAQSTFE